LAARGPSDGGGWRNGLRSRTFGFILEFFRRGGNIRLIRCNQPPFQNKTPLKINSLTMRRAYPPQIFTMVHPAMLLLQENAIPDTGICRQEFHDRPGQTKATIIPGYQNCRMGLRR